MRVGVAAGKSRSVSIGLNAIGRTLLGGRRTMRTSLRLEQGHVFQTRVVTFAGSHRRE